jgi:pantothenate kinase
VSTWVLVPGAPILLPDVAGAVDPAAELRDVCVAELGRALVGWSGPVIVLAAGSEPRTWAAETPYDVARLVGGDRPAAASLPLALAVGRHLVRAAGWSGALTLRTVATQDEPTPSGLVVAVGDGSLYRHEKGGPGPRDDRAVGFDDQVREALAAGTPAALAAVDDGLARDLGVSGRLPWRLLADAARAGEVEAHVAFAGDPFGPYALVATWRLADQKAGSSAPPAASALVGSDGPAMTRPFGLDDLVDRARRLVRPGRRVVLGLAGSPGAGKSTLAAALLERLAVTPPPGLPVGAWVAHVPMDGFHLADVELDRLGRRERKGAPDTFDGDGYAALLARLADPAESGRTIYAPAFERDLEQPVAGSIPVPPEARLVITEGNYLLLDGAPWTDVRRHLAEVWFCATDEQRRLDQLITRHAAFGKSPDAAAAWATGTDERNAALVRAAAHRADLLVPDEVLRRLLRRG